LVFRTFSSVGKKKKSPIIDRLKAKQKKNALETEQKKRKMTIVVVVLDLYDSKCGAAAVTKDLARNAVSGHSSAP
jgi:hypothetical protein